MSERVPVPDLPGTAVQMVAVGLSSGDVALHKLYGMASKGRRSTDGAYSEPVRVLSLYDWGYGPEALGPVAALQWAPNNRALAVSSPCTAARGPHLCLDLCSHSEQQKVCLGLLMSVMC